MIIGLTGGIGSGKSVVAKVFEILGCAVFYSDDAAKNIYYNADIKAKVIELLGVESYNADGKINKPYISTKIFSDTSLLHKLNEVIHPAVKTEFEKFVGDNPGKIIIKESALLFEAKVNASMNKIIMVAANDSLRIERVMKRDGLSKEQVEQKIKSQLSQEDKIKLADFVIYNNEERFVIRQVLTIYNQLKTNA